MDAVGPVRALAKSYRGIKSTQDIADKLDALCDENDYLRARLAEHERLQTLGGPPPPVDPTWANTDLPAPATATDPSAPRLRR